MVASLFGNQGWPCGFKVRRATPDWGSLCVSVADSRTEVRKREVCDGGGFACVHAVIHDLAESLIADHDQTASVRGVPCLTIGKHDECVRNQDSTST